MCFGYRSWALARARGLSVLVAESEASSPHYYPSGWRVSALGIVVAAVANQQPVSVYECSFNHTATTAYNGMVMA